MFSITPIARGVASGCSVSPSAELLESSIGLRQLIASNLSETRVRVVAAGVLYKTQQQLLEEDSTVGTLALIVMPVLPTNKPPDQTTVSGSDDDVISASQQSSSSLAATISEAAAGFGPSFNFQGGFAELAEASAMQIPLPPHQTFPHTASPVTTFNFDVAAQPTSSMKFGNSGPSGFGKLSFSNLMTVRDKPNTDMVEFFSSVQQRCYGTTTPAIAGMPSVESYSTSYMLLCIPIATLAPSAEGASNSQDNPINSTITQALSEVSKVLLTEEHYLTLDGILLSVQQPYDANPTLHQLPLRPRAKDLSDASQATVDSSSKHADDGLFHFKAGSKFSSKSANPNFIVEPSIDVSSHLQRTCFWNNDQGLTAFRVALRTLADAHNQRSQSSSDISPFLATSRSRVGTRLIASFSPSKSTAAVAAAGSVEPSNDSDNFHTLTRIINLVRSRVEAVAPDEFAWVDTKNSSEVERALTQSCEIARLHTAAFPSPFIVDHPAGIRNDLGFESSSSYKRAPVTRRELLMVRSMGAIRDKPEWWRKVHSAKLCEKWASELQPLNQKSNHSQAVQLPQGIPLPQVGQLPQPLQFNFSTAAQPQLPPTRLFQQPLQFQNFPPAKSAMDRNSPLLSDHCLLYMWQELRWWARRYEADVRASRIAVQPASVDGVFQCDDDAFMSAAAHTRLLKAVEAVERARASAGIEPDVHPGSDGQVINLVHPSMHCLRIGYEGSRYSPHPIPRESAWISMGNSLQQPGSADSANDSLNHTNNPRSETSNRFAWLPADVQLTSAAKDHNDVEGPSPPVTARFLSYINGLHPSDGPESELYPVLEDLVARFVPMWDLVLANATGASMKPEMQEGNAQSIWNNLGETYRQPRSYRRVSFRRPGPGHDSEDETAWEKLSAAESAKLELEVEQQQREAPATMKGGESPVISAAIAPTTSSSNNTRCSDDKALSLTVGVSVGVWNDFTVHKPFSPPPYMEPPSKANVESSSSTISSRPSELLKLGRLQVIIKIATIVLTPEKPTYPGGSWHIEGMSNERIVASGIYYLDNENISKSRLAFRHAVQLPEHEPSENEDDFDQQGSELSELYDLQDNRQLNQLLGSVHTRARRALAWDNCAQHQVQPFTLIDRTKQGHRRIVVAFLVDPAHYVPSTSHVPPQQREWLKYSSRLLRSTMLDCTSMSSDVIELCLDYILPRRDGVAEKSIIQAKQDRFDLWQKEIEAHRADDAQLQQNVSLLQSYLLQLHTAITNANRQSSQLKLKIQQRVQAQQLLGLPQTDNTSTSSSATLPTGMTTLASAVAAASIHPYPHHLGFQMPLAASHSFPIIGGTDTSAAALPLASTPLRDALNLVTSQIATIPAFASAVSSSSNSSSTGGSIHTAVDIAPLYTVSLSSAQADRLELMKERKFFTEYETSKFEERLYREFERPVSLCEH